MGEDQTHQPETRWVNPYGIEHLTHSLADDNKEIYVGEFERRGSRRPDQKISRAPIHLDYANFFGGISFQFFKSPMGYVTIETGLLEPKYTYSKRYESMTIVTNQHLALKDEKVLPACKIKYVQLEGERHNLVHRIRKWFLVFPYWKRMNLPEVLQPDWFQGGNNGSIRVVERRKELDEALQTIMDEEF